VWLIGILSQEVSGLLPRYGPDELQEQVEKILEEAPADEHYVSAPLTKPGDSRQARGVPIVGGRGSLGGAIEGTVPHIDGIGDD
jgi:hypothetical protein